MNPTTLGIDLAKTSFSLIGMDQNGKAILRKTLKRVVVALCCPGFDLLDCTAAVLSFLVETICAAKPQKAT